MNGSESFYGAKYWLRAAKAFNNTGACFVGGNGDLNTLLVSISDYIAPSFCFNLG